MNATPPNVQPQPTATQPAAPLLKKEEKPKDELRFEASSTEKRLWKTAVFVISGTILFLLLSIVTNAAKYAIEQGAFGGIGSGWNPQMMRSIFTLMDCTKIFIVYILASIVRTGARVAPKPFAMATRIFASIEKVRGPGLVLIWPLGIEEEVGRVDTRVFTREINTTETLTADDIAIDANANATFRRTPKKLVTSVFEVEGWEGTMIKQAATAIQQVVRQTKLDAFVDRPKLSRDLLALVNELVRPLGGEFTSFNFADFKFHSEELQLMASLARTAELRVQTRLTHARAEAEIMDEYGKAVRRVSPNADEVTVRELAWKLRAYNASREAVQEGRAVPVLDVGQVSRNT